MKQSYPGASAKPTGKGKASSTKQAVRKSNRRGATMNRQHCN